MRRSINAKLLGYAFLESEPGLLIGVCRALGGGSKAGGQGIVAGVWECERLWDGGGGGGCFFR